MNLINEKLYDSIEIDCNNMVSEFNSLRINLSKFCVDLQHFRDRLKSLYDQKEYEKLAVALPGVSEKLNRLAERFQELCMFSVEFAQAAQVLSGAIDDTKKVLDKFEWYPTCSPPQNGLRVMLYDPFLGIGIGFITQEIWRMENGTICNPTHWKPLPQKPSTDV